MRYLTRVELERLKAGHERLLAEVSQLRDELRAARHDLCIQFHRIAEMQAILDQERISKQRLHAREAAASSR